MSVNLQPLYVGEYKVMSIEVLKDDGTDDPQDLSVFDDIKLQIKAALGPGTVLLEKTLLGGGIALVAGGLTGLGTVTFLTADTTGGTWPATPNDVGDFWVDVVGLISGEKYVLQTPAVIEVLDMVNR